VNEFQKAAKRVRAANNLNLPTVPTEHAMDVLWECEGLVREVKRDRDVEVARLQRELDEVRSENERIRRDGDRVRRELVTAAAGVKQVREAFERVTAGLVEQPEALPSPRPVRAIR
jgi:hypothetical protein